jgi:hypothetical protein
VAGGDVVVSDMYKSLMASPTVKSLQTNLHASWSTVKESLADTWNAEGSFREQEQAYAAAALAEARWRAEDQARERHALDAENVHTYSRNADVTDLRLAARRTMSVKHEPTHRPHTDDDEFMRRRASSLSDPHDNTGYYRGATGELYCIYLTAFLVLLF